ncbi:MAG: radical SAM protein [Eggerthellaceae bacterium]|nr:radical SAM protein [Eggerthellaceae bacterium]
MLQLAMGCTHNACKFCPMYKNAPFALSSREEITADIDEFARFWMNHDRFFLTGGNALGLPYEHLRWALELMREKMPDVGNIGCFARVADVKGKTDDELHELATLGIDDIAIGAECGYDPALAFMGKGHTSADIIEQCARLDNAGISYSLFYVTGIAGAGKWEENARATLDVFGQTHPKRIMIHTLTVFPNTPLAHDVETGAFVPETEMNILREQRLFYAEYPNEVYVMGGHHSNAARFNALLPRDREDALAYLDECMAHASEESLQKYHRSIKHM